MWIAILVVLTCVVAVAMGRGGQMSEESPDYAPLDMGPISATDIVLLRPPTALWGYNVQVTDEALERIAMAVRERDVRIVALEQRIADLTGGQNYAATPSSARHARPTDPPADPAPAAPAPAPAAPAPAAPAPESATTSASAAEPEADQDPADPPDLADAPVPADAAEPTAEAEQDPQPGPEHDD